MAKLHKVATLKPMPQIDSRTIYFVESIFGVFIRDKNTSDIIKNLLILMKISILKVYLSNSKFLIMTHSLQDTILIALTPWNRY